MFECIISYTRIDKIKNKSDVYRQCKTNVKLRLNVDNINKQSRSFETRKFLC